MKKLVPVFVAIIMVVACNQKPTESPEEVYKEAMEIHDEVMPKMDAIFTLKKKLKQSKDSLLVDSVSNEAGLNDVDRLIHQLEDADQGMRDWMHNIEGVAGEEGHEGHGMHQMKEEGEQSHDPEALLKIQKEQKRAIEEVKKEMEESIEEAKAFLDAH